MKIETDKIIFTEADNPVKENLTFEAQKIVPEGYVGSNTSPILAELYSAKLLSGSSVTDMNETSIGDVPDVIDNLTVSQIVMARFGFGEEAEQQNFKTLFYSLKESLDFNDSENSFYVAQLYMNVMPLVANGSITSTVRHLYGLNRGRDNSGRVPADEIRKFIILNKALRREGIVLTATEVFYCSINWDTSEVFSLIEQGMSLADALKMYDVGFKTVEEIVEYSGGVPMDWIDRILN